MQFPQRNLASRSSISLNVVVLGSSPRQLTREVAAAHPTSSRRIAWQGLYGFASKHMWRNIASEPTKANPRMLLFLQSSHITIDVASSRRCISNSETSSFSDSADEGLTRAAILSLCACDQVITEEGNTVIAYAESTSPRVSYFAFKKSANPAIVVTKVNGGWYCQESGATKVFW